MGAHADAARQRESPCLALAGGRANLLAQIDQRWRIAPLFAGEVLAGAGLHSLPSVGGQEGVQGRVADRADQVDEGVGEDFMAGGDGVGCGGRQDGKTDTGQGVVAGADQSLVGRAYIPCSRASQACLAGAGPVNPPVADPD
ncbi:hypothetical protein ACFCX0_34520 [Streptomyces sp. NPDC056352]|uniref:hypothetical protein n=1 Tax=Streptomyces sp. NPDC056352 TaxID=3345791 RepID=UPI0035E15170